MSQRDEVIAGRYLLLECIGTGGMGKVWRAHDQRLGREVAVKQLHTQRGVSEEEAEVWNHRAMREARITARLHHPHAVPVFDVVEHDGQPCLIMQYFPSSSLAEILARRGPLPVPEVARIGSEVAAALATAHQVGIVHRDVKPGNVLIADDGTAKITDFGIAHARGDVSLTSTGMVTGTPAYLAPEVAKGVRATPASDVFSLGSTLYAAIEGQPPFGTGDNPIALLHRVATGDVLPPQRAGSLTPVLLRMLGQQAEDRPGMTEVARSLGAPVDEVPPDGSTVVAPRDRDAVAAPVEPTPDATPAAGPAAVAAAGVVGGAAAHGASPGQERRAPSAPPPSTPGGLDALWPPREEPDLDPVPERPEGAPRRRRNLLILGLLAVAAATLVFGLQALGEDPPSTAGPQATADSSSAPTSAASSPTGSATTAAPSATPEPSGTPQPSVTRSSPAPSGGTAQGGAPTAGQLEQAVEDYYALLPDDTDGGYALLTERYRDKEAGSFRSYTGFWSTIADVRVSDVTATGPRSVAATVRYEDDDGEVSRERRSYRLIEVDGVLKIDDSAVIG